MIIREIGTARPLLVLFGALALVGLLVNLIGITFPIYWHPDEAGKAFQLQLGQYNFYHPQLLLRLAYVSDAIVPGDTLRRQILAGRAVSAVAAAVAIGTLGVIVARRFGSLRLGAVAGTLVAATPSVFISAHFFKEDAVLLMGIALTMLAMHQIEERPSRRWVAVLGIALGVACSAKYVGAAMIAPIGWVLLIKRVSWGNIGLCLLCAALVFLAVNNPAIFGQSSLKIGFLAELAHVTGDHGGIVWGPLSPRTLIHFWQGVSTPIVAVLLIGLVAHFGRLKIFDAIVLVSPLMWLAIAQMSAVSFARYIMPAAALTPVAAVWVYGMTPPSRAKLKVLMAAGLLLGGALMARPVTEAALAFLDNPRTRTADWIRENLPTDSVIAAEFFAGIPTPERVSTDSYVGLLPQKVIQRSYHMAGEGSLDQLRKSGVTYIVISSSHFARFYDPYAAYSENAVAQKKFYDDIFAKLTPIHEESRYSETDIVLSSRIFVYDIRQHSDRTVTAAPTTKCVGAC
ncbi:hypothetical protein BH10PSE11_BH10PSE11_05980 [soil metagenome]